MAVPKTIDDLGYESYAKYEENRSLIEDTFAQDPQSVVLSAMHDSFGEAPAPPSEFDFSKTSSQWGLFQPPKGKPRMTLYNHYICSQLASSDIIDNQMGRVDERKELELLQIRNQSPQETVISAKNMERVKKESKSLTSLMQDIDEMNTMIAQIDAERYRYSKG